MDENDSEVQQSVPLEALLDGASGAPEANTGAFLLVVSGQNVGRMYGLGERDKRIGRSVHADIRIDEPAVSQWHAKIGPGGPFHTIADLGSTNGVTVNGIVIEGEMSLRPGDVIGVGEVRLAYVNSQAEGTERTHVIPRAVDGELMRLGPQPALALTPFAPPFGALAPLDEARAPQPALPGAANSEETIQKLARMLIFLRRHARRLAVGALLAATVGAATLLARPPQANAFFEVTLEPRAVANPVERGQKRELAVFEAADKTFKGPDLVKATLEDLGLPAGEADVESALARLKFENLALDTYRGEFTAAEADVARQFLERHVHLYVEREISKNITRIQAEVDFLTAQLADNERELSRTEQALRTFKEKHILGLPEFAEEQLASRHTLSLRRDELQAQLTRLRAELALAENQLGREDAILERKVVAAQPYEDEVVALKRQLEQEKARGLHDTHPDVIRLQSQLVSLERLADDAVNEETTEIDRRANPVHRALASKAGELRVLVRSTRQELGLVSKQLERLDGVANRLPEVESTYAELTRSYTANQALHDKLFAQLKSSQLQLELERASAAARYDIIVPPTVVPASFTKAAVIRMGAGAFLGCGLVVLMTVLAGFYRRVNRASRALIVQGPS